jgi:predicted nucleic acid-binding protein
MADYLLDTNHASPLVTLSHPLRQRILQSLNDGDNFATCVPVVAETLFGIALLPRAI